MLSFFQCSTSTSLFYHWIRLFLNRIKIDPQNLILFRLSRKGVMFSKTLLTGYATPYLTARLPLHLQHTYVGSFILAINQSLSLSLRMQTTNIDVICRQTLERGKGHVDQRQSQCIHQSAGTRCKNVGHCCQIRTRFLTFRRPDKWNPTSKRNEKKLRYL